MKGDRVQLRETTSQAQLPWDRLDLLYSPLLKDPGQRKANLVDDDFFEEVCKWLETSFTDSQACECCDRTDSKDRCGWCFQPRGWHRCHAACLKEDLTLQDLSAFKWARHSLYNVDDTDVERSVFDMIKKGRTLPDIEKVLQELTDQKEIPLDRQRALLDLAAKRIDIIADTDPHNALCGSPQCHG